MIVEYIRYTIDEGRRDGFAEAYRRAAEFLLASPHCHGFELAQCVDDPGSFTIRIIWDSIEGHFQGFRTSAGFAPFFQVVAPYYHDIAEMRDYRVLRSSKGTSAPSGETTGDTLR